MVQGVVAVAARDLSYRSSPTSCGLAASILLLAPRYLASWNQCATLRGRALIWLTLMAARSASAQPAPANLPPARMLAAVPQLERRKRDLETFDLNQIQDRRARIIVCNGINCVSDYSVSFK